MLADLHTRRTAGGYCRSKQTLCSAPKVAFNGRSWLLPLVLSPAPFAGSRSGRGTSWITGGGAPDQGGFSIGNANEDTLELAATKTNLREANDKIQVLMQQVAIVEELQLQMIEQDELIAELEHLIRSDKQKQETEREALNGQLSAAQEQLAATAAELDEARSRLSAMPDVELLQGQVAKLQATEAQLEAAQAQLQRLAELEALETAQQQLQQQLETQTSVGIQLARDLDTAREQLSAAQAAAVTARQEAQEAQEALARKVEELAAIEADVETMRKTMNKGGKKSRGRVPLPKTSKGFASPPPPAAPAQPARLAENHLREELKQAQNELEQLQVTLDEREAQLQAAQSAVEFLTSQCKEQELHLTGLTGQFEATRRELEERLAAEAAAQQRAAALEVRLRAEANDKELSVAALKQQLESQSLELQSTAFQRDQLVGQVAALRSSLSELEDRRQLQDMAVGELDVSLQELRLEVESAQQLKVDLAILAEAFSNKEAELEAVQERLDASAAREAELREQAGVAESSLGSLRAMLSELQTTNLELHERFEALEGAFRARSQQVAEAEAVAADTARQLGEAREQLGAAREQLSARNKALSDTTAALSEAQSAEASQRMAAQALSERLAAEQAAVIKQSRDVEVLREQVAMLNEQITFLSGSESAVKKLQDALRRSDGELVALREELSGTQAAAAAAARVAAADRGVNTQAAALSKDVERLQRELSAATSALTERENALALARRGAEATEAELRAAKRAADATAGEVATMRTQVVLLSGELTAVRQERDAASRAEFESLRQLQNELAAEAAATLELLNKAESLVLASSEQASWSNTLDVNTLLQQARNDLDVQTELWEAERQRSASLEKEVTALSEQLRAAALGRRLGAGDPADDGAAAGGMTGTLTAAFLSARGSPRDMEAANMNLLEELNVAKDSALSARSEAEALQTRVQFLERELRSRDALITELRSSSLGRGPRGSDPLVAQLKQLQEENTKLKQAAARQQQLLNQTKRFFEKKISPNADLSFASAGGSSGGSGAGSSSPSRNGPPKSGGRGTAP